MPDVVGLVGSQLRSPPNSYTDTTCEPLNMRVRVCATAANIDVGFFSRGMTAVGEVLNVR
jgi:hypothetical protein